MWYLKDLHFTFFMERRIQAVIALENIQDRDRFLAMFSFLGSTGSVVFRVLFYNGK